MIVVGVGGLRVIVENVWLVGEYIQDSGYCFGGIVDLRHEVSDGTTGDDLSLAPLSTPFHATVVATSIQ